MRCAMPQERLSSGCFRRELLRFGGLGALGLALPDLLRGRAEAAAKSGSEMTRSLFGRARNIIYVFLNGGPSQFETFDPKPNAPAEVRGSFRPIATNVPGIDFCELLPRTARVADKLAVVRSMSTDDPNHESGGYYVRTGHKYIGPDMRALHPTDWPALGAIVKMLRPSPMGSLSSVMIPEPIIANPKVFLPGQNAGFLGRRWDPEIFTCDPSAPNFVVEGFALPEDLPVHRLEGRRRLLVELDGLRRTVERTASLQLFDEYSQQAMSLLISGAARAAFRIEQEAERLRDRYGRGKWGQTMLLARRLIEAGVRMVFVNWPREPGDLSAGNPLWDTHSQNDARMRDVLCPQFDLGFTALIEDLDQRGLLDETLVVAIGEMGRTPRFNAAGGRDHWGNVFSFVMAGAGIKTALVHGASDRDGAYVASGRVRPEDLTATIAHLLGIGHQALFRDATDRPLRVTEGEPIEAVLGDSVATLARREPEGIVPAINSIDTRMLVNGDFEESTSLSALESTARGWRAAPLHSPHQPGAFGVRLVRASGEVSRSGEHHACLGWDNVRHKVPPLESSTPAAIPQGTQAWLLQEIYNPRPGLYTVTVHAAVHTAGTGYSEDLWHRHFRCRLILFGFADKEKNPRRIVEFASTGLVPVNSGRGASRYQPYSVSARLESQNAGALKIDRGVGVAVVVEKSSPGVFEATADSAAFLRIDDVQLVFTS